MRTEHYLFLVLRATSEFRLKLVESKGSLLMVVLKR